MYPLGVSTPEGIIKAAYFLFKVYREARDSDEKVAAAARILDSVDITLRELEQQAGGKNAEDCSSVQSQICTTRAAWTDLEQYLAPFRKDRIEQSAGARKVYRNIRWALDVLEKKVLELQHQVNSCLLAVIPRQIMTIE